MYRSKYSKTHHNSAPFQLNHDINHLLTCFNQLERKNTGYLSRQAAKIFFRSIEIADYSAYLPLPNQTIQFDDILSILGTIEFPTEPSIYVLTFIKLLAQFRNNCLHSDDSSAPIEADSINKKIHKITEKELHRQTIKMELENQRTFQQMQFNQNHQFLTFQKQWNSYIDQYGDQARKRISQTIDTRNRFMENEQSRFVKTTRRYSVLTSTKLIELEEKKAKLVKEGKYNEALTIKQNINQEKQRLLSQEKDRTFFAANKRFESLNKKKDSIISATIATANSNVQKLIKRKREGEKILRIKMKSIREETIKKLNQHVKTQIQILKSLFSQASKG